MNNFIKYDNFGNDVICLYTKKDYDFGSNRSDRLEQIEKLENEIGIKFKRVIIGKQEHTNNVVVIDENNYNDDFISVDGFVTNLNNIAICTITADCQNIFLYDSVNKVIGCVHSGWKGTYNQIIVNAINIMKDKYNSNTGDIKVIICPSICQNCFQVDEDLNNDFVNKFGDKYSIKGEIIDNKQKYYIDTKLINKDVLINMGILENNIYISDICTKCENETYHSYRGAGKDAGRNLSLIALR